ncbi:MAG: lytic transglycosylase domain-containing protein [Alphaproteobacteria bacterium]|nr:lytic transglycosylase domain-containing protein [Alphaproteobacteria bacterium]
MPTRDVLARLPRFVILAVALCALAACSTQRAHSPTVEATEYAGRAKRSYAPPGPPSDPWGPYIVEAAGKYDVPEKWIREVIRQESGGRLFENGKLITSSAGAMGLMQVMPATYDELRQRYSLGDDPFEPHDNIMAGTAYLRELYDVFGSPGFLAAYNAGPGRLDDYLTRNRGLPDETRRYVARVGAAIGDSQPQRITNAPQYAMLPVNIPPGPRNARNRPTASPVMLADRPTPGTSTARVAVLATPIPAPPGAPPAPAPSVVAAAVPAPSRTGGFTLISPAMADTLPRATGGARTGNWAIQVGAFANEAQARAATDTARRKASDMLAQAKPAVGSVRGTNATLYRARLTGLSRDAASGACEKLTKSGAGCIVLSPDAQS